MIEKLKKYLTLLRIRQYYKNVLIAVGAFFGGELLNFSNYFLIIVGFVLLCCVSSINYIINDIKDIEKDKKHEEKLKKKPLANGDISVITAILILVMLCLIIVFSIIFLVDNIMFVLMLLLLLITGQLYNHLIKDVAFWDIVVLSLGYLWRVLAGCFLIEVYISPWLFIAVVEVALFLVIAKRKGDLIYLGEENAAEHKKIYEKYTMELLDQFHTIIATSIFITYCLYLIIRFNLFSREIVRVYEFLLIFSVPLLFYIIMRYMYIVSTKPELARHAEKIFFDKQLLIAGALLAAILAFSFYYTPVVKLLGIR